MARRKKYPKLPNGYGSIKYLGKGRRNPYGVYPPVTEFTLEGVPVQKPALCYVDDWMKGFAVLTAYHAGTYVPGMEKELTVNTDDKFDGRELAQRLLADYNRIKGAPEPEPQKTFREVYEEFYEYKFERDKSRAYSASTRGALQSAFKNAAVLHDRYITELKYTDLQAVIDDCPLKHSSVENIRSLFHQMYEFALIHEIVEKDYSAALKINKPNDDEHGVPFTDEELHILWRHKDNPTAEMILIMCYSGYRISAYQNIKINMNEWYFRGGIKTAAGKDRIVPIHSGIRELVQNRMKREKALIRSTEKFRFEMYDFLDAIGIEKHTPHDCRHTFSKLCEKYKVNENDRKRLLGHSFGNDITNGIYGHRSLEDLRSEIEKIQICC